MLRDTRSYETQIIDAVRAVNRALGGTYGTSSAIHKSEYNQYEVQLIDAIRGIGRTLSGKGLSLAVGGGGGDVTSEQFQALSQRVTKLESESFFRLVDGNVTLKESYRNLWVPGWLAAGGVGSGSGGGGSVEHLSDIGDVSISNLLNGQGIVWDSTLGKWKNATVGGGGGSGTVTSVTLTSGTGISVSHSGTAITTSGTRTISISSTYQTYISHGETAYNSLSNLSSRVTTLENESFFALDGSGNITLKSGYSNLWVPGWLAAGGSGAGGSGGSSTLAGLDDVSLSSPTNGQSLVYRNGAWTNELVQPGGGGSVTSVGMTVPTGLSVSGSPITSSGTLAVSLASGYVIPQQATLDNFVTLNGTQTITGAKTFTTNPVTIGSTSSLSIHESSYIDLGPIRIKFENDAVHITKASTVDTKSYGLYADGFVAAGGVGSSSGGSLVKYVNCSQAEYNAISPKDPATIYTIGDPVVRIYIGSIQLYSEN